MKLLLLLTVLCTISVLSCNHGSKSGNKSLPVKGTPVTVVSPEIETMSDSVELNATSVFLLKTTVKAVANGYLQISHIRQGQYVKKGQTIFVLKTKEAENLGNTINKLDTSFHFTGTIPIKATGNGYISQLTAEAGSYVQDGEQLATIADNNSFAFILSLPYEYTSLIAGNEHVIVELPDGQKLAGTIEHPLPSVDSIAQTQNYVIKVISSKIIPENLIAKVRLLRSQKRNVFVLPKAAVLSDEAQTNFWIMKIIDSTTAVKVPVIKGMEVNEKVEILSPPLNTQEKILVTGNYGLEDTATVSIINK